MKVLFAFLSACHLSRRGYVISLRNQMRSWEHWGLSFDWRIIFGDVETQKPEDRWTPQGIGVDDHCLTFPVEDSRRWMVAKNQELFKWAMERDYDVVFRACDDSVVYPHRLLADRFILSHDYFGTMCGYGKIHGLKGAFVLRYMDYMHGGVGIGLSRASMQLLIDDVYPGPDASPYGNEIHVLPNHAIRGGWGTYWDDLWIGETLKGHLAYNDSHRENMYYNYKVSVYDNPQLFVSNKPFDDKKIIARHSLDSMGDTTLQPGPFSTKTSKAGNITVPWQAIHPVFNLHEPTGKSS